MGGKARGLAFTNSVLARSGIQERHPGHDHRRAPGGRAGDRDLRQLHGGERPPFFRARGHERGRTTGTLRPGALPRGGLAGSPSVPGAGAVSARGPVVEPARRFALPAFLRGVRDRPGGEPGGNGPEDAWTPWRGPSSRCTPRCSSRESAASSTPLPTARKKKRWRSFSSGSWACPTGGAFTRTSPAPPDHRTSIPPHRSAPGTALRRSDSDSASRSRAADRRSVFRPRHPQHRLGHRSAEDAWRNSQSEFLAVDLDAEPSAGIAGAPPLLAGSLADAEADGVLGLLASTWSKDSGTLHDGISRPGSRLLTLAPLLRMPDVFPLGDILTELLKLGEEACRAPVELEFAASLSVPRGSPREFGFVQLRRLQRTRRATAGGGNRRRERGGCPLAGVPRCLVTGRSKASTTSSSSIGIPSTG